MTDALLLIGVFVLLILVSVGLSLLERKMFPRPEDVYEFWAFEERSNGEGAKALIRDKRTNVIVRLVESPSTEYWYDHETGTPCGAAFNLWVSECVKSIRERGYSRTVKTK